MTRKKPRKSDPGIFERILESASHAKENIGAAAAALAETVAEKYESAKEAAKSYIVEKVKPAKKAITKAAKKTVKKSSPRPVQKKSSSKTVGKSSKKTISKSSMKKKAAPEKRSVKR